MSAIIYIYHLCKHNDDDCFQHVTTTLTVFNFDLKNWLLQLRRQSSVLPGEWNYRSPLEDKIERRLQAGRDPPYSEALRMAGRLRTSMNKPCRLGLNGLKISRVWAVIQICIWLVLLNSSEGSERELRVCGESELLAIIIDLGLPCPSSYLELWHCIPQTDWCNVGEINRVSKT